MNKLNICFAAVAALALCAGTAAMAEEYNKADAMSVAAGKPKRTDCSTKEQIDGKTYCFENEASKGEFMKDSAGNVAKADTYWQPCKEGIAEYMYCD